MLTPWSNKQRVEEAAKQYVSESTPELLEDTEDDDEEEGDEAHERQALLQTIAVWKDGWDKAPSYQALTREQKDEADFVVESFAEYMYSYLGVLPVDWNVADMEECCVSVLPRKLSIEETYYRALAPVLASFFTFLGKTGRLANAAQMARSVMALEGEIVAAATDPGNWGTAKSFAMAAIAEGVDLTDEDAMQTFMARYNAMMIGATPFPLGSAYAEDTVEDAPEVVTYARMGPKVGRNDPCPCGSGKKYKKCCGSL